MDCPIARRKLREAEFFLKKLKAERSSDGETFSFYLSAFLSAFKSTMDAAEKEMTSGAVGQWRGKLTVEDQERLSFLTGQRNKEVHHQGATTERTTTRRKQVLVPGLQALSYGDLANSVEPAFGPVDGKSGLPLYIEVARDEVVRVFRIKGKRHVAMAVCEGGVVLLRSLLR